MKLRIGLIVFCGVLCVAAGNSDAESKKSANHSVDAMLLILSKLEVIEHKLQKTEESLQKLDDKVQNINGKLQKIEDQCLSNQKEIGTALNELRSGQKQTNNNIFAALQKLEDHVAINVSELQNRYQEKIDVVLHKLDQDVRRVLQNQDTQQAFSSCKNVKSNVSGAYSIGLNNVGVSVPFRVYCEQNAFGGGWIVLQHRYDGSLDFYRGWNEFRDGFGDVGKEFWLGLEKIHQITKVRKHELIVELKDFSGNYAYARYDTFEIGSEDEDYALKDLGTYNGTAGESMSYNKQQKFSTKDRDNDRISSEQCAQEHEGAWWHYRCTFVNLHGRYMNTDNPKSMSWDDFKGRHGLSYSRMMIREVE
ncbi:microfibril-associated glycoprotein 4-like [Anopheles aquasalis]|uniref:microfibril-associated glycoprotein 4-like n=1 Tax=Anopheles aquasalis TaxID=42839 RepID=UPI00215B289A|nr:microfibril-associated glycoprotein 4-like [Anopheles aquasalis]